MVPSYLRVLVLFVTVIGLAGSPLLAEAPERLRAPGAGMQQAFDPTETSVAVLQEIFRHRRKPWEKSRLRFYLPRVSLVAGAGEKLLNWVVEENGNRLGFLLTESTQPSSVSDNPYVDMTMELIAGESLETRLAARISSSPGDLTPDRVLGMALDAADGDYWLAMLTAHNLLKEVTYAEREQRKAVLGRLSDKPYDGRAWVEINPAKVTSKLRNLRQPFDQFAEDKMGPWYHMYGLLFVGGVTSGSEAEFLAGTENFTRALGLGSTNDPFKEQMNRWAGGLSHLVNQAVETDVYIPENLDELDQGELESTLEQVIELHRERQQELERTQEMVTDERWGPVIEWNREVLRRFQQAFYNESVRLQLQLEKLATPPPVVTEPLPATLYVTVVDADEDTPVAGVAVSLEGPSARRATGPTGSVSIDGLAPGRYRIVVSAAGYEPRSGGFDLTTGATRRETVRMRRVVTSGMRLEIVDAATGERVGGFHALVQGEDSWTDSDRDGLLIVSSLPVGEQILEISAEGYETLRGSIRLEAGVSLSQTIPLQPVSRPAVVQMTILDAVSGNRIPYALLRYEGPESGSVTAGVDGSLSVQVSGGTYQLRLSADGYEPQLDSLSVESGQSYGGDVGMHPLPTPTPDPTPTTRPADGSRECREQVEQRYEAVWGQIEAGRLSIERSRSMAVRFNVAESCGPVFSSCDAKSEEDWYPCRNSCAPTDADCKSECSLQTLRDSLACHETALRCTISAESAECGGGQNDNDQPQTSDRCPDGLLQRGTDYIQYNTAQAPTPNFTAYTLPGSDACNAAYGRCEDLVTARYNACLAQTGKPSRCMPAERREFVACANEQVQCVLKEEGCL